MKVHLSRSELWLMEQGKHQELCELVESAEIPTEDAERLEAEARAGGVVGGSGSFLVKDGVAHVHVRGVLMKSVPWWARYFGAAMTSTPELGEQIREAADRADVRSICMHVDSPGGQAAGIEAVADLIREVRAEKPVTAVIEDMAASGGYWLASQASEVVVAPGGRVGSIGAYLVSVDSSKAYESRGVAVRVHRSGELKGTGEPGAALTDAQLAYLDEFVEEVAGDFRAAISAGRGMTASQVEALATGRMWRAADAKSHGLVDRIESVPAALSRINRTTQERRMADEKQIQDARAQAVEAERQRVSTIKATYPEDQAFALEQIEAGASVSEAAVAYVPYLQEKTRREKDELEARIKARQEEDAKAAAATANAKPAPSRPAAEPVPYGSAGGDAPLDFCEQAKAYAKEHGTTIRAAMSYLSRTKPELHQAYLAEASKQRVKIEHDGTPRIVRGGDK